MRYCKPKSVGIAARKRLFQRLDDMLCSHGLVWIAAPGASGKSMLVSSYLEARRTTSVWLTLESFDRDPANFLTSFSAAVTHVRTGAKAVLPVYSPELAQDIDVFYHRLFISVAKFFRQPCVMVIDNCEVVDQDADIWRLMGIARRILPEHIRLVFISRTDPPPAFVALRLAGRLRQLEPREMNATRDEIQAVAAASGVPVTDASVEMLYVRTEGWIAAVITMLDRLRRGLPVGIGDAGTETLLFDYLASEIYAGVSEPIQHLLLCTCLLHEFTVDDASALSGESDPRDILDSLCRRHLFIEQVDGPEPAYRVHPLYREFLVSRILARAPAAMRESLQIGSAAILARQQLTTEAVDLLVAAGRHRDALILLREHGPGLLQSGRNRELARLLLSVPAAIRDGEPRASYLLGIAQRPYAPEEARAHLQEAFEAMRAGGDQVGALQAWCALIETFLLQWHKIHDMDSLIDWLRSLPKESLETMPSLLALQVSALMTSVLTLRGGRPEDLKAWSALVFTSIQKVRELPHRLLAIVHCSHYLAWVQSPVVDAPEVATTIRDALGSDLPDVMKLAAAHVHAALAFRGRADVRAVLHELEKATDLADTTGIHVWDEILMGAVVHCAILLNDRDRALMALEKLGRQVRAERRHGMAAYHYLRAWVHLVFGTIDQARVDIDRAMSLHAETGYEFPSSCALYGAAVIYAVGHDLDDALALVQKAVCAAEAYDAHAIRYSANLVLAYVHLSRGDEDQADSALRVALGTAARCGYMLPQWWWYRPMMSRLVARALEANIEVPVAQALVRYARLTPPEGVTPPAQWPWRVRARTLGGFNVLVDDVPLRDGRAAQKPTLQLLRLLAGAGPEGVAVGMAADCLWPDADGDKGKHALEMAVHRLRKLLGDAETVLVRDGRLTLNPAHCHSDAQAFACHMRRGLAASGSGDHGAAACELGRALALYQGPYLGDAPVTGWAAEVRKKLAALAISGAQVLESIQAERHLASEPRSVRLRGPEAEGIAL